ncbi:hypothetical protein HHL11_23180 [Ramlibacter sp. G-1-2-2]|uniref:Lipoprotein n=1 Tax=Ramlibacter agri TaxID=2728837 RepID=A0A848HG97_9BURK|nr:hypothetical protein [Ramlibacter agri]NML46668.1 hypothetical protein [Ramlibacter agri]
MKAWMRCVQAALLCAGLGLLASCGGGGGGGSTDAGGGGSTTSTGGETPVPSGGSSADTHQLFVSDRNHSKIAMLASANPPAGTTLATQGMLDVPGMVDTLAYDSGRNVLYAVTFTSVTSSSVVVYADASKLANGATPSRTITLPADVLLPQGVVVDAAHDTVYVAVSRQYDRQVLVYANASTASGAAPVARTMTFSGAINSFDIDFQRNLMYVVSSGYGVLVFKDVNTANGTITPSGSLLAGVMTSAVTIDAQRDRLYAADVFAGVHIVGGASLASPTNAGTIAIPYARVIAVDSANDRLYVGAYETAYLLQSASTLSASSSAPAAAVNAGTGSSIGGFAFR